MKLPFLAALCLLASLSFLQAANEPVKFDARTTASGRWSDAKTWAGGRVPQAGDRVQIRIGHSVIYDVESADALRMVHVAGTMRFARDRNTRLDVGLLKVSEDEETTEDGFNCHDAPAASVDAPAVLSRATLEMGTAAEPIPAGVTALVRLVYFPGTDPEALPAIINCGGRWEIHGAPLSRTWLKLGAPAEVGATQVTLTEAPTGWRKGDHVIVTASKEVYSGRTYRNKGGQTEERTIVEIAGDQLTLNEPLDYVHYGAGEYRSEVANLSRNVIVESADPAGVRGHTMYHRDSTGGISYAEFRHLGKENVLGKYALHFHLVRDTMRGSGVIGASIWDSHNRWLTVHGTDYLLVRDCVGFQSVGHGFYLEDGTEQYNVFDRNLAVQAVRGKRLPKQVLAFDANEGSGFWWANGRNTFTRNITCENDLYGYRFEVTKNSAFNPELLIRQPDGTRALSDIRTLPFLRFEDNESHSEGLYSFNFGDPRPGSVHGDREHPFIVRNLKAWETHYALRPDVRYFMVEGLDIFIGTYGVYHPAYDEQVYRQVHLNHVDGEPINRGNDDDSIQYGSFTYDGLTLENCRTGRDPLIQLTCTSPTAGATGHFRNLVLTNSDSRGGKVVDLGGGPRNKNLEHAVPYYFHGYRAPGTVTKVMSIKFPEPLGADFKAIEGFTGKDVLASDSTTPVAFPQLLNPVDDLPPATMITSVQRAGGKLTVSGVSQDNGDIASIKVNGVEARPTGSAAGVVDWTVTLDLPVTDSIVAEATDKAGNREATPAKLAWREPGASAVASAR
ncbi:MAG TPA: G8 domain-containing protein [Chthoniobacteraceae bacterium]|jgi:hypothetical protein|nr:G8 domain-containing protein [Chthoniobacteraceae bacterium]